MIFFLLRGKKVLHDTKRCRRSAVFLSFFLFLPGFIAVVSVFCLSADKPILLLLNLLLEDLIVYF